MAVHRGRIDLLERQLAPRSRAARPEPSRHEEIYPPELGCHADHSLALHGTPLAGATLLHLCVDFDEMRLARWLIARGADVNATAAVDADGFGGHTPLFACVVSQPLRLRASDDGWPGCCSITAPTQTAAPRCASGCGSSTTRRCTNIATCHPLGWGERFHDQGFVSRPAMRLIASRGGQL